jgi:hypothetical protein
VCGHQATAEIAKAILAGNGSNRTIASRFNLTPAAIQRHRVGCLNQPRREKQSASSDSPTRSPASNRFETDAKAISTPADLLRRLESLFRLGELLEGAYAQRDVDSVVKLAREYRQAAESYARIAGWLTEGSTINLDQRKQSIALFGGLDTDEIRRRLDDLSAPVGDATDNRTLAAFPGRVSSSDIIDMSAAPTGGAKGKYD